MGGLRADVPCAITNNAQPFAILSIARDTNGAVTLTWESCSDHLYEVQGTPTHWSSDIWYGPALMGDDVTTTWTDLEALWWYQMFYRVQRLTYDGDEDGDELSNFDEFTRGTQLRFSDSDGDNMPDGWEVRYGLDPSNYNDRADDLDDDGLANANEFLRGSDPSDPDSDGDEMKDGWEVHHGLNPINREDAYLDSDGDGYTNRQEYRLHTWPSAFSSQPGYLPRNLVGWWRLDEKGGTNVSDASLNQHHGTVIGGNVGEVWTSGALSNAASLGGPSNIWIQVPYHPSLTPDEEFTLTGWVKPVARGVMIANWDAVAPFPGNFRLQFGPNQIELWLSVAGNGAYETFSFDPHWSTNEWHHLAVSYDGLNLGLFVDGELKYTDTVTGPLVPAPNSITLGSPELTDAYAIDDVRIYNRALGTNEIASFSRGNALPIQMIVGQTASLRAFGASEGSTCQWTVLSGKGFFTNIANCTADFRPSWSGAVTIQVVYVESGVFRTNLARTFVTFPGLSPVSSWNEPVAQYNNNCYNFSTDIRTDTFAQPGRGGGAPAAWPPHDCIPDTQGAIADGLQAGVDVNDLCHTSGLPEGHIVALLVWPDVDYHFIRLEPDGTWASKAGNLPATRLDNSGQPIKDARTANFGGYRFCGFFWVGPNARIY